MSGTSDDSRSNNVNAPQIAPHLYLHEKSNFAGFLIAAILYGVIVTLFFRCMCALLDPANRMRGGLKWGLVAHITAMFSLVTMLNTFVLNSQSNSYIDNREFPGVEVENQFLTGPIGYQESFATSKETITRVAIPLFPLNQWLLDGLLLHRCYIVYSMNHWAIAFPCLVYLASIVTGIIYIYEGIQLESMPVVSQHNASLSYYSICVSLNALLTLMIVMRLVLHMKRIRDIMGSLTGASGFYMAIITTIIESHAPYTIAFILYIGPWAANSPIQHIFSPILCEMQVIAPFLVILRVANRKALTSDTITGTSGSIRFVSQLGSMDENGTLTQGDHMCPMETTGETSSKVEVGAGNAIEEVLS